MPFSPLIGRLIEAFRVLPGVGPKSAQRMAFHVLERNPEGGRVLASALLEAIDRVGHCERCRMLSETPVCSLCENPNRDGSTLCVVESPADVIALEKSAAYKGRYFVLMGRLSPLDGMGPAELGMDLLESRLASGDIVELIMATNPTVEGEATAHYVAQLAHRHQVKVSRIAHGVPLGGELEYIDGETLSHALAGRREV